MAKTAKTYKGTIYKRASGTYWLDYYAKNADGTRQRFQENLKVTTKPAAVEEATRRTQALLLKKDQHGLEKILRERVATIQEQAKELEDLETMTPLPDAWTRRPYDTNTRGTRRTLKPRVVDDNRQAWGKFVEWMAENYPTITYMEQVTEAHARAYSDHCRNIIGPRGHNLRLLTCRVMFSQFDIAKNPFVFKNWKRTEDPVSRKTLTPEEEKVLLETATGELKTLVTIGLCTGMRLGDCCTLEWADVSEGRIFKKTAKRGQDVSLALHSLLSNELEALPKDGKYIMPKLAEQYEKNPANVSRKTKLLFEKAGIVVTEQMEGRKKASSRKNFHCLRHTFITQCARRGVPKTLISSWIGHSPQVDEIYQQWDTKERDNMILAAQESRLGALAPKKAQENGDRGLVIDVVGRELTSKSRLLELVGGMTEEQADEVLKKLGMG